MLRPRRDIQIPLRYRTSSPLLSLQKKNQRKRPRIDVASVERDDVDQALAAIAAAPECTDEPPTLLSTELPQFEANYVQTRSEASKYAGLSKLKLFSLFFNDVVVEILIKEINFYAEFQLSNSSLLLHETRHWVFITAAEIRIFINIHLYFSLYFLATRKDYWTIHKLGEFMSQTVLNRSIAFF
jgi:Transposase IS4